MSWRSTARTGGGGCLPNFFLVILSLVFAFGSYNLLSLLLRNSDIRLGYSPGRPADPVVARPADRKKPVVATGKLFHVALTATEAPYSQWQSRIMYYWYKKMKNLEGSDMGGFTRILHNGKSDDLMDEIPTVVVQPLDDGVDQGYVVLNRPWAFVQWLEKFPIEEDPHLSSDTLVGPNSFSVSNSALLIGDCFSHRPAIHATFLHLPKCRTYADILTKALPRDRFHWLRTKLNVVPPLILRGSIKASDSLVASTTAHASADVTAPPLPVTDKPRVVLQKPRHPAAMDTWNITRSSYIMTPLHLAAPSLGTISNPPPESGSSLVTLTPR